MPEEEIIIPDEPTLHTIYTLLTLSEYYELNKAISEAKGYQLGDATEVLSAMNPQLAKTNVQVVDEVETYDLACIMVINVELQTSYPELLTGLTLIERKDIIPADVTASISIDGDISTDVVDWTMNHCTKQGVDTTELVTYMASQDASNYPPIPAVGEWCDTITYAYNGDKAKCLQAHTRMSFTPEETPALWLVIPTVGGYPAWVQPAGAHTAYAIGDRVHFPTDADPIYESLINANVWSPTTYPAGWEQL